MKYENLASEIGRFLMPPERISVYDWAERYRYVSASTSPMPGKWHTIAPYQKGVMEAITDTSVRVVVLMFPAQSGKTEILLNTVFYYIHTEPSPIMLLFPNEQSAKEFVQHRLNPNIQATPVLKEIVYDTDNLYMKTFPGGYLSVASSTSTIDLASKPVRILVADEIDRFYTTPEGDALSLAIKRTSAFPNSKIIVASTPTLKTYSRIESLYLSTDQRKFYVPCPKCNQEQVLQWGQVKWDPGKPETARYVCEFCGYEMDTFQLRKAVQKGIWKPTATPRRQGWVGFWVNGLYNVFYTLEDIVAEFLEVKSQPEKFQVFVNTVLAETWEKKEYVEVSEIRSFVDVLMRRREVYTTPVPPGVKFLTCGADVQTDRIEAVVLGFADEETYVIEHAIVYGNTSDLSTYEQFYETVLKKSYEGDVLHNIQVCFIDSGFQTQTVYDFCRAHKYDRIFPLKGKAGPLPVIAGMSHPQNGVTLYEVGVDTVKHMVYSRLHAEDKQYFHFPISLNRNFFESLCAEIPYTKISKGVARLSWRKIHERNEVFDCVAYAFAASYLISPTIQKKEKTESQQIQKPVPRPIKPKKKGWLYN